jgi:peptidoglycan-N-acetylglucosamine deacetylase
MRLACVSIDLDEIPCYADIHGLTAPPPPAACAVYGKALARYQKFLDRLGIAATFFAVGGDLQDSTNASLIAELHASGHEIANHSAHHYYDLIGRDRAVIREEIARGADEIDRVIGTRPRGFRAPGYSVSDELFELLAELSIGYDSSLLPSPLYYGAKALAMGAIRIAGRQSRSILTTPMALTVPTDPFRLGKPYWHRGNGLLEIPIAVTPALWGRLPFIGTTLALAGEGGARWLARTMVGKPLINIELHGIDLVDAAEDGVGFLLGKQPDLRKTAAQKEANLRAALEVLRDNGYRFVRLDEIAARWPGTTA